MWTCRKNCASPATALQVISKTQRSSRGIYVFVFSFSQSSLVISNFFSLQIISVRAGRSTRDVNLLVRCSDDVNTKQKPSLTSCWFFYLGDGLGTHPSRLHHQLNKTSHVPTSCDTLDEGRRIRRNMSGNKKKQKLSKLWREVKEPTGSDRERRRDELQKASPPRFRLRSSGKDHGGAVTERSCVGRYMC